jgi:hypothetical protein
MVVFFVAVMFATGHISREELGEVRTIYEKIRGLK